MNKHVEYSILPLNPVKIYVFFIIIKLFLRQDLSNLSTKNVDKFVNISINNLKVYRVCFTDQLIDIFLGMFDLSWTLSLASGKLYLYKELFIW